MAGSFFGVTVPQECAVAQQFLKGVSGCCPAGNNPACDQTIDEGTIPALYSSITLVAAVMPMSDGAFRQALGAGRLVLGMIAFPATYHFIAIGAVNNGTYTVNDPEYDAPFPASFGEIANYPQGTLANAWLISHR